MENLENSKNFLNLLNKYANWAKYDYMLLYIDESNNTIKWKDLEENKTRTLNQAMELIFDNGMLNECYTQEELKELKKILPFKKLKDEIKTYIKKEK